MIHLNGRLVDALSARIDPSDRGFLLADGLFETLRIYGGKAFKLEAHLARLAAGAKMLDLPMPPVGDIGLAIADTLSWCSSGLRTTLPGRMTIPPTTMCGCGARAAYGT